MPRRTHVAVVVTTFNRPADLERCLAALGAQSVLANPDVTLEVLVVDDCSDTAEASAVVARHGAAGLPVRLVRHARNRGLSASRNTGIRATSGDVVVFLDDDIAPGPGYVAAHLAVHARLGGAVATVGNLRYPADLLVRSNLVRYLDGRYLGRRADVDQDDLPPRNFGAGVSSIRRADLATVGGFEEAIRFYGAEDVLMGQRLRNAGVRLAFAQGADAVHHDDVTLRRYRAKILESARESTPVLRRLHPEFFAGTQYRFLLPPARDDAPRLRLAKRALRALLNRATIAALEGWVRATDRVPVAYLATAYHALLAGWFRRGVDEAPMGGRQVEYG